MVNYDYLYTMKRFLLVFMLSLLPVFGMAQKFPVKVVGVSDGDTFTGLNRDKLQIKFRIYGIDAPEKRQAFGKKSKEYLSQLIFGKDIVVDVQSQDGWGRYIAYVYTGDGEDVSLLMIRSGFAWHFAKYDSTQKYIEAEAYARSQHKGLWQDRNPEAPWEFRKKK